MSLSKRTRNTASVELPYGRIPPQAVDVEKRVLGAILMEKGAFDIAIEILPSHDYFYTDPHQHIYKAMMSLVSQGKFIDTMSVVVELKKLELLDLVGGPYYLTQITNDITGKELVFVEQNCNTIAERYLLREVIKVSMEGIGEAYEDSANATELLDKFEGKVLGIRNAVSKNRFDDANDVIVRTINRLDMLRASNDDFTGVPTGYGSLDKITHGWQDTDLIILGARPAMGKTGFSLNLARNAALHPTKPVAVGFFSLEMGSVQLMQRMLSAQSEVLLDKITTGKMDDVEYKTFNSKGVAALEKAKIFIDDVSSLNLFEFRSKARRMVNKNKVKLIIIDYLQLMSGTGKNGQNREQDISEISRGLKGIAKELKVPIIALCQLSRKVEDRKESKLPRLSDINESGSIEANADIVMFLYRPEYYEINSNESGESTRGETHLKIAKHRNGALDTIKFRAKLHIQKFVDLEEEPLPPTGIPSNFAPVRSFGEPIKKEEDDQMPF